MPFYEYQCKNCDHALEAMQKISDAPLKKCPHCGKSQLQRLMSAPVFRLKGGGWYETDFKGEGDNKRNLVDKPEADAPKETKETEAKAKDGKDGKDAKTADTKASDSSSGEAAKPNDKAKDKPADKAEKSPPTGASKNAAAGKSSARGRVKRLPKKTGAKAKKRR
jgi:putative FmdB family regulatory protein